MKLSTLFIALFLTTQVVGQPVQKIKQLLKDKNFVPLNKYVDNPPKTNVDVSWEMLRTIVGNYQEGIVKIEENVPSKDGTGGHRINNFRIYLLTTTDKIFYYKFIKTVYKNKGADQWERNEEIIEEVKENKDFLNFDNLFRQTYGDTLNQNDLFFTSIVYGGHCGIVGVNPEYKEQLNLLLQDKNIDAIRHWLKSANAEKQLYALLGYRILLNQGYTLTDEESRIVNIIKQKKGTVSTCSGCMYMTESFQNVVSEIDSIPEEYLKPEKTSPSIQVLPKNKKKKTTSTLFWVLCALGLISLTSIAYFRRRAK